MKKIFLFCSLVAVAFCLLFACNKTRSFNNQQKNIVTLYNCGQVEKGNNNVSICFDSLITESRCPANANCIWQGYALIKVSFHENNTIHHFKMVLPRALNFGAVNDTIINGYKIVFTNLEPYPGLSPTQPTPDQIKASFDIFY